MVGCSQTKGPIGGVVGLMFNKNQCWAIIIIIIIGLKTIGSSFHKGLKNLTSSNFELFEKCQLFKKVLNNQLQDHCQNQILMKLTRCQQECQALDASRIPYPTATTH
jgi:hypothetical protein